MRYAHEKVRHLAGKINEAGEVSALCSDPPRRIRLQVAGWVALAKYVSCKKCLEILRKRGVDLATYSVFDEHKNELNEAAIAQFELVEAAILTGQMPQERLPQYLEEHPDFAAWYRTRDHGLAHKKPLTVSCKSPGRDRHGQKV